ncbi:MAG: AbrB/MazE/SpoVT family DNA-binding domain-containing protein [Candidatus Freyarchaeum deiterrae]
MTDVVLSSKGQMIIPKGVREKLGLKVGQRLRVEALPDGTILVIPLPDDVVKAMRLPRAERLEGLLEEERRKEEKRAEGFSKELSQ